MESRDPGIANFFTPDFGIEKPIGLLDCNYCTLHALGRIFARSSYLLSYLADPALEAYYAKFQLRVATPNYLRLAGFRAPVQGPF